MPISQITGASIQDGSIVVADLGITTFNTGTGNTLTLQANSATGLVIDVTGNTAIANTLSFTGTGARIRGDFSNDTFANRTYFQSSITNGNTKLMTVPNGTAVTTGLTIFNNSDINNSSYLDIATLSNEMRLTSTISGTGTLVPLTFRMSATEALRIDTSGSVLVGTTSALAKLAVVSADGVNYQFGAAGTTKGVRFIADSGSMAIQGVDNTLSGSYQPLTFGGSQLIFQSNGTTERARIDASGRLGIGTNSPSQLLHVAAGTILSSNTAGTTATVSIAGNGSTTGTSDFSLQQGTSSEAYVFNRANSFLVLGTNNTERMRITSGGILLTNGLTSSPGLADSNSSGVGVAINTKLELRWNNTNAAIYGGAGGADDNLYYYSGLSHIWRSVTEKMRLDANGSLCVGTTNNRNARIAVQKAAGAPDGISIVADSGGAAITIFHSTSTGTPCYFATSAGVAGSITVSSGSTAYNTSSDYRLKENIAPMTGALDVVAQLKPVTYNWKADGSSGQGFIAHELQAIVPDCVSGTKDAVETVDVVNAEGKVIGTKEVPKYQGIDTSFLVATLTAAIQELNAKFEELKAKVTALENK